MKFNLPTLVMFGIGSILLYSAVKDKNPKQVVVDALNPATAAKKPPAKNPTPPLSHPPNTHTDGLVGAGIVYPSN